MKFHFDANQKYQLDAIRSVIDVFEGQPLNSGEFSFSINSQNDLFADGGIGNKLVLEKEQILKNVNLVQQKNNIEICDELDGMHYSVEMETGTGKTYVYLRTIYELNKLYGFKKFVIVVPSIAIREGVLKNLEVTYEHFKNLYDNVPAKFYVYDSKRISNLRNFSVNNNIQILVINIDSFAKDENIINRPNDKLTGKLPIEFIQNTRPIVIVDEPQNMETEKRKYAIEKLNYLCTLRYSATHIKKYNLLYSLDPVAAYDLGLVKQIEVDSIVTENDFNNAYVAVEKINVTKTRVSAKLKIDINVKEGVTRKTVTAKVGDDLYDLSNRREIYKTGYIINEINAVDEFITVSNGETIYKGAALGGVKDEIIKTQIRKTIEEHLNKEKKYQGKNLKILSLFFVDKVSNYRLYDESGFNKKGKFALWFEEIYNEIVSKNNFKDALKFDVEKLHNGYFSQDKKGNWKDTKGNTKIDDDTFKLIMKDKERLLDINEPLRFVFSHSALREGWDNPNVFQICTLNETQSELKKRQEIGRGLRLAVNRDGFRLFDKNINRLTVIANECYEDFAKQLQIEIEQDCGVDFSGRIKNKQRRKTVKYKKGFELDEKFKEIWEKIKYKTRYRVNYNTQELIRNAALEIKRMPSVKKTLIHSYKTDIKMNKKGVTAEIKSATMNTVETKIVMPDILLYIQEKTELTRKTIFDILQRSDRIKDLVINPQMFLDNAVKIILDTLNELMINGIKYEKIGNKEYEMRLFEDFDIHINNNTFKVNNNNKTIFENLMPLDSNVEYEFAKECECRDDIEFYFKLPFWFKINTPIGNYNPDWALIKKNIKTVYFVAETKSGNQELRVSERQKIKCGYAHFREFDNVEYRKVSCVSDLD